MAVSGHPGLSESCICARPGAKADKKAKGTAEALASEPCLPEGWVRTILSVMADKSIEFLDTYVVPQGFLRDCGNRTGGRCSVIYHSSVIDPLKVVREVSA